MRRREPGRAASREAEFSARRFDLACEVYCRDEVSRQWFVADDVESGIERRHADRVMTVIWRHSNRFDYHIRIFQVRHYFALNRSNIASCKMRSRSR